MEIILKSVQETSKLAKKIALDCLKSGVGNRARVIGLYGELGAGKTTFTQSFAKALGIREKVVSPTFVIEKIYKLKGKKFKHLIHIDAYRIENNKELEHLGWDEVINNPENIIIVEWADKVEGLLPKDCIKIKIEHVDESKRKILIK
jgi:tRNA threonylcarbamoyladenosine biosynthesis protein TsaE